MVLRLIALFGLAVGLVTNAAAATSLGSSLIAPFHVEGLGAPSVIRDIAAETGVPFGLETDLIFEKQSQISFDFPGGPVSLLAEMCSRLLPNGKWMILGDRSIKIYTTGLARDLGSLRLSYPGANRAYRREIWSYLATSAELTDRLTNLGCKRLDLFHGWEWRQDTVQITLPARQLNLEDLLEESAVKSHENYWEIVKNSRQSQCEVVITLW